MSLTYWQVEQPILRIRCENSWRVRVTPRMQETSHHAGDISTLMVQSPGKFLSAVLVLAGMAAIALGQALPPGQLPPGPPPQPGQLGPAPATLPPSKAEPPPPNTEPVEQNPTGPSTFSLTTR